MATNNIVPGMLAKLSEVAVFFVDKMKQKIDDVNAPKVIKEFTFIDPPMSTGEGKMYVDVIINMKKDAAPMAVAYEYGTDAYRIPPEGETFMAFDRSKWPTFDPSKWRGKTIPNVFVFSTVQHPPIVARPYIRPTIEDNKEEIKKMLGQAFKAEILRGVQKLTVIEVGK